ncbi:Holliday junction resolvase RuvX [Tsukamurella strandjordii]|uniref:Putative pre-16S rRNA nuclease n=1 Tax=Tsukamurella strandjordii TaxID=147577 RepID=A0AA90NFR7_9ACTN|nr:Holliday junction resolvase RuvX [Tsukamurella strandjordii]MDP0397544.1 Holliday junction resolvase RuvX [Tsukamurella strandjordii]
MSGSAPAWERGRRLALDVGKARIGVAVSDPDGILATPVETVKAAKDGSDLRRIARIVEDYEPIEIVVGLPRTLRGDRGSSAHMAEQFAERLAKVLDATANPAPRVCFSDERFTTVTAQRALRDNGVRAKEQRAVIDQAAAVAILQGWLDERRPVVDREEDDQ